LVLGKRFGTPHLDKKAAQDACRHRWRKRWQVWAEDFLALHVPTATRRQQL
jgi:hypothetical protein